MNKDIIGKLVKGRVIRKTENNYMVEFDNGQIGLIPSYQVRQFGLDDIIEGLVVKPVLTPTGMQYKMSRGDDFLVAVFKEIVPYLRSGQVVIERIARLPGQKTKIAVRTQKGDESRNAAAVCIGENGSYVQKLQERIGSKEFIDVVNYSEKPATFIANAMYPGEVEDVLVDFTAREATVLVNEDVLGLILGKKGSNLHLAQKLCDFKIVVEDASAYIRQFNLPPNVTLELLKAKINNSDRLIELLETSNKDHKISKQAFDILTDKVELQDDEDEEEEDEEEDWIQDIECPECGKTFTLDTRDKETCFCPHCGQELDLIGEEEEDA